MVENSIRIINQVVGDRVLSSKSAHDRYCTVGINLTFLQCAQGPDQI